MNVAATDNVMTRRIAYEALCGLLGKRSSDRAFRGLLGVGEDAIRRVAHRGYINLKDHGVDVVFELQSVNGPSASGSVNALVAIAFHLHSEGHEGFREFRGDMPHGLAFGDPKSMVVKKLGPPATVGEGHDGPRFLIFERDEGAVHCQLNGRGLLDLVTVGRPRRAPPAEPPGPVQGRSKGPHLRRPAGPPSRMTRFRFEERLEAIAGDHDTDRALRQWDAEMAGVEPKGWMVEAVLHLIERHPLLDYGSPGPLVHFSERLKPKEYEPRLVASLARHPTRHAVLMMHRWINGVEDRRRRDRLLDVLRSVEEHPRSDEAARAEAAESLSWFSQEGRT